MAADRASSGVGLASGSPRTAAYLFCPLIGCVRRVLYVLALHVSTATATGPAAPTKDFELSKSAWRDDEETVRVGFGGCARDQPCAYWSWGSLSCSAQAQVRCGAQPGATILGQAFQKKTSGRFYIPGLWPASTRARFSDSESAASESCLLGSMTFARSSRAVVRYPAWIATTTSRPRSLRACSAQGSTACWDMRPHAQHTRTPLHPAALASVPYGVVLVRVRVRPLSPGVTSSWNAAASSLACSHPPPAPRVRVATPIHIRELRPLPRPVPGHRARCSRPFVAGEPGCRRQVLVSWVLFEGAALAGSVTRRSLRRRKKKEKKTGNPNGQQAKGSGRKVRGEAF